MNYQMLIIIGIILLCLCGVSLVINIILFIRLRIISIINDLSGKTEKKQIEKIRLNNNNIVKNKRFNFSMYNKTQSKISEQINIGHVNPKIIEKPITEKLENGTEVLENGTQVLSEGTEVLDDSKAKNSNKFIIKKSIILINTLEVI